MRLSLRFLTLPCVVFLVFPLGCTKKDSQEQGSSPEATAIIETKPEEKPFEYCSAHKMCSDFSVYEAKCRADQNEKDCQEFVNLFDKLAIKNDCKRKLDKAPVPSVWICDEVMEESTYPKLFERSATTLSKLKHPFALKFYGSETFRSTLDGAVAEEHLENSLKLKTN